DVVGVVAWRPYAARTPDLVREIRAFRIHAASLVGHRLGASCRSTHASACSRSLGASREPDPRWEAASRTLPSRMTSARPIASPSFACAARQRFSHESPLTGGDS